jgi:hypothetical protein
VLDRVLDPRAGREPSAGRPGAAGQQVIDGGLAFRGGQAGQFANVPVLIVVQR